MKEGDRKIKYVMKEKEPSELHVYLDCQGQKVMSFPRILKRLRG